MTNEDLALSYLQKSIVRRKALQIYMDGESYSDVVRESQEPVELLSSFGNFDLDFIAKESKWLRKERELAMYGDLDFIPSSEYSKKDAERALAAAESALLMAKSVIKTGE